MLLLTVALLAHFMSPRSGSAFTVRTHGPVSIERLAAAVAPFGRVESRARGSRDYVIHLFEAASREKVSERLNRLAGVEALEPDDEPVNLRSVSSLDRKIERLREEERGKGSEAEEGGLDYFESYRYFIGQRAFPKDSVDWSAYPRASAQVARMQPALIAKGTPGQNGPTWEFVGPTNLGTPYRQYFGIGPVNGRVNALAYDPNNSQTIYAGGAQGGLWKSTNAGTNWTWLSAGWAQIPVNTIVVDPMNSDVIYVGLGDYPGAIPDGYGIMKSTDGGATWKEIATASIGNVGVARIMIDPTNDQTIIAGTGDFNTVGAIYRSTDAGKTWTVVLPYDPHAYHFFSTLAASVPAGSKTRFYALAADWGNMSTPTSRLYVSDDHGATWQNLVCPYVTDGTFHWAYWVCTSPTNPNTVYILDSENAKLNVSNDQGKTWTDLSSYLPTQAPNWTQAWYNYYLQCSTQTVGTTSSDVLYLGQIDIQQSIDGGHTWESIGGPTYSATGAISHNDQHALAISPADPNQAIYSSDGGVYHLTYTPSTGQYFVTPLNATLGITQFYKIAAHPTDDTYVLGGSQDNACPWSHDDFGNWLNVGGGDGGGCAINQTNPLFGYVSHQPVNGVPGISHTFDGWNSWWDIDPPVSAGENLGFVSPLVLAPTDQTKLFWGSNFLYEWDESALQWTSRLGGQDLTAQTNTSPYVQAIAVSPTNISWIYTGSSDGALFMTTNGGANWTQIKGLPSRAITSISINPANSADILVGLAGTGSAHLWRCANTQAGAPAFTAVSGGGTAVLPDIPLNAIARDLNDTNGTWWVGTDIGVFRSADSGASWQNAGASLGLPNVIVNDMVAVPGTRYLNVGTYGRGMWRIYIPKPDPLATFTLAPTSVVGGGAVTGTVTLSAAAPLGGVTVNLSSADQTAATVPATVGIPSGSTEATFQVTTVGSGTSSKTVLISAGEGGATLTQSMTVAQIVLTQLTVSPNPVEGGTSVTGAVTLNGLAPAGGLAIGLSSSSPSAHVPTSVQVPAGSSSATFTISTTAVTSPMTATITGTESGVSSTAALGIQPFELSGLSLSASTAIGGSTATVSGTLTFNGPGSGTIKLLSSNSKAASVPATVKAVLTGAGRTATFTLTHMRVSAATTVTITASIGAVSKTAQITVEPFAVTSLTLAPTTVAGGVSSTGAVTLNASPGAKNGALVVALASSSKSATVPGSVKVPVGSPTGSFTVKTSAVASATSATINASVGTSRQSAQLSITAPSLTGLSLSPTAVKGSSSAKVTGTVSISSAAPSSGLIIALASSMSSVAAGPATVKIAGGKTSATFTVIHKSVTAVTSVTLTATLGSASKTATLSVTP